MEKKIDKEERIKKLKEELEILRDWACTAFVEQHTDDFYSEVLVCLDDKQITKWDKYTEELEKLKKGYSPKIKEEIKYKSFDELIKKCEKFVRGLDKNELKIWNNMTDEEKKINYIVDFKPHLGRTIKEQCFTITIALKTGITKSLGGNYNRSLEIMGESLIMLKDIIKQLDKQ